MIRYKGFSFCSAPRTATTWTIDVLGRLGIEPVEGRASAKHQPWPKYESQIQLSMVRHPYTWLKSYYFSLGGGHVDVPAVDNVFKMHSRESKSFTEFVGRLDEGAVGTMFDTYKAGSVLRMEDLPHCLFDFLAPFGFKVDEGILKGLNPLNQTSWHRFKEVAKIDDKKLRAIVTRKEEDFCDTYDYW